MEDEGVISEQRQRIGGQFVQQRIAQTKWRLVAAWTLLLPKDVGDIVGAERTCRRSLFDRVSNCFGPILADEFKQFGQLARKRAVGFSDVAQIRFQHGLGTKALEKQEQALLGALPSGRGAQFGFCQ